MVVRDVEFQVISPKRSRHRSIANQVMAITRASEAIKHVLEEIVTKGTLVRHHDCARQS